jgi:hypothetical protein
VLYLYKYLFKGNRKISIHLNNTSDLHPDDENNHHLRGRMLCSHEAAWRGLGYQIYPASEPTVVLVKVKGELELSLIEDREQMSDLAIYFARPDNEYFADLKYCDFYKKWMYAKTPPKAFELIPNTAEYDTDSDSDSNSIETEGIRRNDDPLSNNAKARRGYKIMLKNGVKLYLYPRSDASDQLVRMGKVPLSSGEKWYLRYLLIHHAAYSHDDLKHVDGKNHQTFQAAAVAKGLVTSEGECVFAFNGCEYSCRITFFIRVYDWPRYLI